MLLDFQLGQQSIILRVKLRQNTTATSPGQGMTGLANTSTGLIVSTIADAEATATAYTAAGATIDSITTLGTYAAPTAGHCAFKQVDATNHPGLYEIQLANARYNVANAKSLIVSITGVSGMADCDVCVPLRSVNPYDGTRGGMTALPNANASASGGLPTIGAGAGQVNPDGTGAVPVAYGPLLPVAPAANTVGFALKQAATLLFDGSDFVKSDPQTAVTVSGIVSANVTQWLASPVTAATAGVPDVNTKNIGNAAVSATAAQIGVNVVNIAGHAAAVDANNLLKVDAADWGGAAVGGMPNSGSVTVAAYAAGEDPATLVLSATASSWDTAGTIGAAINAAGGSGDPWATALPGAYAAGTAGYVVGHNLDAAVSSRLASASYAAPPTTAQIATAIWTDLLASSDFATASSIGNLLKTGIDTNIGSRLAASDYVAPPTTAQIATAVLTDTADNATADSPGAILRQLAGAFTTTTSSVFTAAALANAPTGGGGGSVTVAGYAAGEDPATLVLGALASSWDTAGTIGGKINAAGASGDPLANLVPGSYASGTAGNVLGHLSQAQITVSSIVAQGGDFIVLQGDSYYAADGRALTWTDASGQWPNLTGASLQIEIDYGGANDWTHAATALNPGATNQTVQVELSQPDTQTMPSGRFKILATLASGHTVTLVAAYGTASAV